MIRMAKISIAVACALGMSAAFAQTVQRGEAKQTVAQAGTTAPIQTAQAGAAAGGAASGASTGGFVAGIGVPGTVGSTVVFVGSAVAAAAVGTDNPSAATSH
jgi:hypothetical protein